MLKSGVHKNSYSLKDFSHERTFGAVDPKYFPDEYNADLGLSFPDQNADGLPNACTGYAQSENGQNENGELFDPKFTYEKTLAIENAPPGSPCQIRDSLKSTRTFGLKRKENDSTVIRGAYYDVDKVGDYFDGVRSALWLNNLQKRTVSCGTPWFHEWGFSDKSGILEAPKKYVWDRNTVGHNYLIVGWKTVRNVPYLILKPWIGPNYGDHGYAYVSREIFNKVMAISGTFMYIQSNLAAGEVQRVKLDILELTLVFCRRLLLFITTTSTMPSEAPKQTVAKSNGQKLYETAKASLGQDMSPQDLAPDSLACMESLDGLWLATFGEHLLPVEDRLSTELGYESMLLDNRLEKVDSPLPGDIVISPTGFSEKNKPHGHCGIWGKFDVMSNSSDSGKWTDNYTHEAWYEVFQKTLGFPVIFFRVNTP